MQKDRIIGIGAVVVILIFIVGYALLRPVPAKAPTTPAPVITSLPASSYVEHAPYYDIATNYATSTPLQGSANDAAIVLMQNFVGNTIAQFKKDGNFANLTAADVKTLGFDQGRKYTLEIRYLIASSARTVSYIFTTREDTGGAHSNTFFHTFVFDTSSGNVLTLADVFLPNSKYLDILSSLARAKLPAVIGEGADANFIKDGTTPEAKNFQNFFFDNKDFVILFDPYAVASYANGPQTLRIPLSQISTILKPEYQ